MTSVTDTRLHHPMMSPRESLQKELDSEISSGTIQESDRSALEDAFDAIDQAMQANRPTEGSGRPSSPQDMQQKLADLVDEQVDAGTLTSDQADELKQLFASAAPQGGPGGPGGGPGGPPPPESEEAADAASSSTSSSSDLAKLLEEFLKQLQEKKSSTTTYGAGGATSSSSLTSLVLDTTA